MFAVAVGGITVAGLEDEEDTNGNQHQSDVGADPRETLVLGKAVDEQTNGQPDGSAEGSVQTGLRVDNTVGVGGESLVLADLEEVQSEADSRSDAEGDIGKTGDTLVPATLLLESDGDHGQEKEGQEPGETDPETKGEDHGLGEQHLDGLDGRVVEHLLDTGGLEVVVGDEALITSGLPEAFARLARATPPRVSQRKTAMTITRGMLARPWIPSTQRQPKAWSMKPA